MAEKPAILRSEELVVHEGWAYRILRGGSIVLNKLMFSAFILLAIWLLWGYAGGHVACTETVNVEGDVDAGTKQTCSVLLTPTSVYLSSMALLSFVASILFGLLGLVVGKRIVEASSAMEEVGAVGSTPLPDEEQ